jgi:hypothetical protein
MDDQADQQAQRVGERMALAPLDPLAGVEAANPEVVPEIRTYG